jgi:mono/diheme cytochrome c family protein
MTRMLLIAVALLAVGCDDEMSRQPRYDSGEPSTLFPDGTSMQVPPEGAVGRDDPAYLRALDTPPPLTMALLIRGRERYGIYCQPCHDAAGYGRGTVPSRGFPNPPSYHQDRLRKALSRHFVDVITHGYGIMYSYADRVSPTDRWAIAAYIRALQLSQSAPLAALSDQERSQLAPGGR